jgi:hypothetical protein
MPVRIPWVCDTCGAVGEIDAELPATTLDGLTIEDAARATFAALVHPPHQHPVRLATPLLN